MDLNISSDTHYALAYIYEHWNYTSMTGDIKKNATLHKFRTVFKIDKQRHLTGMTGVDFTVTETEPACKWLSCVT